MYYVVPSAKTVDEATRDLEAAVRNHQFGVLHVYDLKETLTKKGYPLGPQCKIFEVCNPQQAARVLQRDIRINMALPCRISIFEDAGVTKIGAILPAEILRSLSQDGELREIAGTVEATIKEIVAEAAAPAGKHAALSRRRATLAREIQLGAEARRAERGDNVPDAGELAAENVTRDVAIADIDRDAAELAAIDAALERIEEGTYGRCVACGAAISPARLDHVPEADRCLPCQQRAENQTGRRIARL
jgi:RNA polymerase-binding transcription factor DksA/uncharacterized protein (DUF302 family)